MAAKPVLTNEKSDERPERGRNRGGLRQLARVRSFSAAARARLPSRRSHPGLRILRSFGSTSTLPASAGGGRSRIGRRRRGRAR